MILKSDTSISSVDENGLCRVFDDKRHIALFGPAPFKECLSWRAKNTLWRTPRDTKAQSNRVGR